MDCRELENIQKINRLKSKHDCLSVEIVVPANFSDKPVALIQGNGGNVDIAILIDFVEKIEKRLKKTYPEARKIARKLSPSKVREKYKSTEMGGNKNVDSKSRWR